MNFKNTSVMNIDNAIRGMRNAMESWQKGDTVGGDIGENDMVLAKKLVNAGDASHRKFLRQIFVSVDITAPLYFWKEADTYKINTVANSTSTMHKLATTPITLDCFEIDDYDKNVNRSLNISWIDGKFNAVRADISDCIQDNGGFAITLVQFLECLRQEYIETNDKKYWRELIRWLPSSWLQTRTWTANYEVLRNIYHQRKNHKLSEWKTFCNWVETLPYAEDFLIN